MKDRVIALAGLIQAIRLVQEMAETGSAEGKPLESSLASVFRIDADSAEDVYGGLEGVRSGLRSLVQHLDGSKRHPNATRIVFSVLLVERKLAKRPDLLARISAGIQEIEPQMRESGVSHPTVLSRLGELYAGTVSTLSPRVLVQGNPLYLSQPAIVSEIRALLMAAMRAAVLWRQMGGTYWDFVLRRGQLQAAARKLKTD